MTEERDMSWFHEPEPEPEQETEPEPESQWRRQRREYAESFQQIVDEEDWGNLVHNLSHAMYDTSNGRASALAMTMCAIQLKRIADILESR
jgi:hypothetical protein